MASCTDGPYRRGEMIEAFKYALKLVRWLPLCRKCFQLFTPTCRGTAPPNWAIQLNDAVVPLDQPIKLCLMTGVIEFSAELFFPNRSERETLSGPQFIVSPSPEQVKYGRVVAPAVVIMLE